MKNFKNIFSASTIIVSLVTLTVGFAGGFLFEKSRLPSFRGGNMANRAQMMGGTNGRGYGRQGNSTNASTNLKQTMGEITGVDSSSITIKTPDGGSKIVLISDSTTINKAAQGTKTDLTAGAKVSVTGDSNTDGSVTGKTININSTTAVVSVTPTAKK